MLMNKPVSEMTKEEINLMVRSKLKCKDDIDDFYRNYGELTKL